MSARRLPVYFVIDCSRSMNGELMDQVRRSISSILADLRSDPFAVDSVHLSLVVFSDSARQLIPLTPLTKFQLPELAPAGATALGAAFQLLTECLDHEVRRPTPSVKGDLQPLVFLMTVGHASDNWRGPAEEFRRAAVAKLFVCTPFGPINRDVLDSLPGTHISLSETSSAGLKGFFKWCSSSIRNTPDAPGVGRPAPPFRADLVHFSVSAPATMVPGQNCVLDVWAFMADQREEMMKRAQQEAESTALRFKSKGGARLERGTVLAVRVELPAFEMSEAEDTLIWESEVTNASFPITAPAAMAFGTYPGVARVYAGGLQITKIHFVMEIASQPGALRQIPSTQHTIQSAFASYASADRDAVLARIQGIQKAIPNLDVFLDVASLRSGEVWLERLTDEIMRRDVFYLFWSKAASQSEWVRREWQLALKNRGAQFIDPVPLVDPQEAPPPPELAKYLHFNDWVLAYMRRPAQPPLSLPPPPPGLLIV